MADTTFVDYDISLANRIVAAWLNDVNNLRYGADNAARGAALLQYRRADSGAATRTALAKMNDVISVKDFGATGDGVTDDYTAIAAAIAVASVLGGIVFFPAGTYRTSATLSVLASGVVLQGVGVQSIIISDLAVTPAIKFGDAPSVTGVVHSGIKSMRVTRATGTPDNASIGIDFQLFNYAMDEDVLVERSGINRRITGNNPGISIEYDCLRPSSRNAKIYHLQIQHVAGVKIFGGQLGMNGGETWDCTAMICVTGEANDVNFDCLNVIPTGPDSAAPPALLFASYTNTTGVFKLSNFNTESTSYFISSDASTPVITDLTVDGSRIATDTGVFNLNAATQLIQFSSSSTGYSSAFTLTNPKWMTLMGTAHGANVSLIGGATASANITGITMLAGNLVASAAWTYLGISGTTYPGAGALANTATGTVSVYEHAFLVTAPTVTANTNAFTTVSAALGYQRQGNFAHCKATITITTNGTAAGSIKFTLPADLPAPVGESVVMARHSTGVLMFGRVLNGSRFVDNLVKYDGTYLGGDGTTITLDFQYQV